MSNGFILGKRSLRELEGVHSDLVAVVKRAIELTHVDFTVVDGLRTIEEQRRYVASGASKTMRSRHLTGHAVDLVPYINGKIRWEHMPLCEIAEAVREAALELGTDIRWGGCWKEFTAPEYRDEDCDDLVEQYVATRRSQGRSAFVDTPHFELPKRVYG